MVKVIYALALISFAIALIAWFCEKWRQRNKPQEKAYSSVITFPENVMHKLQEGDILSIKGFGKSVDQRMRIVDIKGDTVSLEPVE